MSRMRLQMMVLTTSVLFGLAGCDQLVGHSAGSGSGGGQAGQAPIGAQGGAGGGAGAAGSGGSGGSDPDAAPATGGVLDSGAPEAKPAADAGPPPASGNCEYPAGAPMLTATRFQVGTILPNLSFQREDGSTFTFKDIYCNKKHRLLLWSVGGDNCSPCVAGAQDHSIPGWKALGADGLFVLESFNGQGVLLSAQPFPRWRQKTMWPADADGITLVREPQMPPWYVTGRVEDGLPFYLLADVENMKVLAFDAGYFGIGLNILRTRLMALPPRR